MSPKRDLNPRIPLELLALQRHQTVIQEAFLKVRSHHRDHIKLTQGLLDHMNNTEGMGCGQALKKYCLGQEETGQHEWDKLAHNGQQAQAKVNRNQCPSPQSRALSDTMFRWTTTFNLSGAMTTAQELLAETSVVFLLSPSEKTDFFFPSVKWNE